jgi:hypothetical protein
MRPWPFFWVENELSGQKIATAFLVFGVFNYEASAFRLKLFG